MKISNTMMMLASGVAIPVALAFLGEALVLMIPWFITMFFVIMADLIAGLWKSYKLEIPIRFSKACRETMGKMLVYAAFVCMICCINVAAKDGFNYAKWAALLIIIIEGGSILGNILKPHGISLSLNALIKAFLKRSPAQLTCPETDEIFIKEDIDEIRRKELEKEQLNKIQHERINKKRGHQRA